MTDLSSGEQGHRETISVEEATRWEGGAAGDGTLGLLLLLNNNLSPSL